MIINNERQPRPVDDEPTEESPLLAEQEDAAAPPAKPSRFMQFQRAHLALPVVFFGFFGLITSSPVGILAAKFGRKPLLIGVATIAMFSALTVILALHGSSMALIFVASALSSIAGPRQFQLLSTMFVVDLAPNPAPVLSILEGSIHFGLAISYALGGVITTRSGSLTTVFWVQMAISATILLYIILAIPETFGRDKRAARAAEVAAEQARGRRLRRPSLMSRSSSLERVRDTTSAFARPFGLIWPRRDLTTGKRNKRLLLLSAAMFFASIGATYVGPAWMVFVTNRFHATPEQNGYVLSLLSSIKTVYLLFVLPVVLKWGRSSVRKNLRSEFTRS
ncbi:hypothetical protein FRC10_004583, partial [Ceratobasidium sp. 414]